MPADRIAYTAYTQTCTFLLDGEGFCRRILMRGKNKNPKAAKRCINAQYVASLVLNEGGGLVEMPTVGAPLIFARIDNGRVSLVRTGPLERFIAHDDIEGRERELASLARTEEVRVPRRSSRPPAAAEIEEIEPDAVEPDATDPADESGDVIYHDAADRTHQLRHVGVDDDATVLRNLGSSKKKGMLPKRS